MLSDIAYRDYAVLLVCLDAEWTRQTFNSEDWAAPFANVFEEFTTNLWRYRGGMADYRKRIPNVVSSHDVQTSSDMLEPNGESAATDPPDPRLFNSLCYVPFGHSDGLGVVLIDDCEVAHHLAETTTTTVESLSLAFCPELKSLGVTAEDPLFCDLEQMLAKSRDKAKTPECTNPGEVENFRREAVRKGEPPETWRVAKYRPARHEFETAMPLLAFSTYKMDGLGTVGPGVLFQQAVFRAMIQKIRDVVSDLRAELEKPEKTPAQGLLSLDDLNDTRCALLDLQCAQEVGTLIFCPNATVAASILSGLRGLTYQDLLDENADVGGHLKTYFDESDVHEMIWRHSQSSRKSKTIPWENLSVFRWTDSSISVAWSVFTGSREEVQSRCRGLVEPTTDVQMVPGQRVSVSGRLRRLVHEKIQDAAPVDNDLRYYRYLMGGADLRVSHGHVRSIVDDDPADVSTVPGCPLVPMADAVEIVRAILQEFGCANEANEFGREVCDCSTSLAVPVPKFLFDAKTGTRYTPLMSVLRDVRTRLCFPERLSAEERKSLPSEHGKMALAEMSKQLRKYGVPQSLRRSINSLFRHFATLLGDPFLFDVILDLYDPIAAIYKVFQEQLMPKSLGEEEDVIGAKEGVSITARVEEMSKAIDALNNALEHRMSGAFREPTTRDMAVDFRGGLQQMLHAADVPIKCGLGVLRRFVMDPSSPDKRDTVGIPTKIEFEPGVRVHACNFQDAVWLGYVGGDVPHVLTVSQYGDHLHEAFHIIVDELRLQKRIDPALEPLTETCVIFLCQLFLCRSNVHGFRRHRAISFAKGISGVGTDDRDTCERHTEWLTSLFLATDVLHDRKDIREDIRDEPAWWDNWVRSEPDREAQLLRRFKEMLDDLAPFLPEFAFIWHHDAQFRSRIISHFHEVHTRVKDHLPQVFSAVMNVYRRFINDVFPGGRVVGRESEDLEIERAFVTLDPKRRADYEGMIRRVDEDATRAIFQGKVLLRALCEPSDRTGEDSTFDPLLLLCAMLRRYMMPGAQKTDGIWHIARNAETGYIEIDPDARYHELLIDQEPHPCSRWCQNPSDGDCENRSPCGKRCGTSPPGCARDDSLRSSVTASVSVRRT